MNHAAALHIANQLVSLLEPSCKRIEIAGSLRRLKPEVGDIEICAIPDLRLHPTRSLLDLALASLAKLDVDGIQLHPVKGGEKYKQFWVSIDGGHTWLIKLDLFLVTPPAWWGPEFLIRTGPAAFSTWMVSQRFMGGALPNGYCEKDLTIRNIKTGDVVPMPEEVDYFRFCRMGFIPPEKRQPHWHSPDRRIALSNTVQKAAK